ncbi:MAG TPA: hypothetical protein VGK18_13180 [Propionicimonas sp.]|jgi:hypothetical protein|uniref:hypothetical protein n=1 Tax=Propionicimonas sp. TaxID=1955623 RepID=UPI002F42E3F2
MDETRDRVAELREQAGTIRVRAIEANKGLIAELTAVWKELNALAGGRPEVRKLCEHVAGDIARLEKLDLAFDTEWLAEAKRARP